MASRTLKPWKVGDKERIRALGDCSQLPRAVKAALDISSRSFQPVPRPRPGDWLHEREESGQTYASWARMAMRAQPHASYRTIFIDPLGGDFDKPGAPSLAALAEYCRAFYFGLDVEVRPPVTIDHLDDSTGKQQHARMHPSTGRVQLYTGPLLELVLQHSRADRSRLRRQVVAIGVTMTDVAPSPEWNFVFGLARAMDHVGVWSFARMDPSFPWDGTSRSLEWNESTGSSVMFRRCAKVLVHEIAHLFGLKHCIYFHCVMNGDNTLDELDRSSLFLCPVCLRKLLGTFSFDPCARYLALLRICENTGLLVEATWLRNRLEELGHVVIGDGMSDGSGNGSGL